MNREIGTTLSGANKDVPIRDAAMVDGRRSFQVKVVGADTTVSAKLLNDADIVVLGDSWTIDWIDIADLEFIRFFTASGTAEYSIIETPYIGKSH